MFKEYEGVLLEKEKIQKNPRLQTVGKKLLNSLWGKLAQNDNKDFQRVEGVLLEKEKIQKNPALRTIAKKLLNSLWGKLAQNKNIISVVVDFLNDYEDYWSRC